MDGPGGITKGNKSDKDKCQMILLKCGIYKNKINKQNRNKLTKEELLDIAIATKWAIFVGFGPTHVSPLGLGECAEQGSG